MANGGWYGTEEEWTRVEAPLKLLDGDLERFARKHNLSITKNLKDWPERSLAWSVGNIRCLLQIFLVSESKLTLDLWICASEDRDDGRYWKNETLRKAVLASEIEGDLFELLEVGKRKLDRWSTRPNELETGNR